ncbi:MAG: DUF4760 domain-containing protein [Candidatus Dormibacteria bacterium]
MGIFPAPFTPGFVMNLWPLEQGLGIAANLAIIGALLIAAWQSRVATMQLLEERTSRKMSRSLQFLSRWNMIEFAKYRAPLYDFLVRNPSLADLLARIKEDPEFFAALRFTLNFYEELGVTYNRNELDRAAIKDFFEGQIEFLHANAIAFIEDYRRTRKEERLFSEFCLMWQAIHSRSNQR